MQLLAKGEVVLKCDYWLSGSFVPGRRLNAHKNSPMVHPTTNAITHTFATPAMSPVCAGGLLPTLAMEANNIPDANPASSVAPAANVSVHNRVTAR